MRYVTSCRPHFAILAASVLATGCASLGQQREAIANPPSQVVTNEPPAAGGPVADQPPFEEAGSELALGAARLVADNGRWSDVISDDPLDDAVICRGPGFGARRELLTEGGVYRSFEPRAEVRSWVFVGLALGGDGFGPALYGGGCGSPWIDHALGGYTGRLAPAVAGRDTSLLFTRSRRTLATGGASGAVGVVSGVIEQFVPRGPSGEPGRTAKPRTAQPVAAAPASAPATSGSAAPAAAAAAAPKASGQEHGNGNGSSGSASAADRSDRRIRPRGAF
jgi:hypothetical protein